MRLVVKTAIYLFVGFIFFLEMVNFMKFPIMIKEKNILVDSSLNINSLEKNITEELISLEQISNDKVNEKLYEYFNIENNQSDNSTKKQWFNRLIDNYIFFDYVFKNNNKVIPFIYLLTLITFLLQVTFLAWSSYYSELLKKYEEKKLDSIFLYGSEWAINSPPVLGVVGTIFSFGMVVGNLADMSSLSTVFKDNFPNAALTTILGGSIYIINLFLNIFIAKNLSEK